MNSVHDSIVQCCTVFRKHSPCFSEPRARHSPAALRANTQWTVLTSKNLPGLSSTTGTASGITWSYQMSHDNNHGWWTTVSHEPLAEWVRVQSLDSSVSVTDRFSEQLQCHCDLKCSRVCTVHYDELYPGPVRNTGRGLVIPRACYV